MSGPDIVERYRDTMGLTREGAIRRMHALMDRVEDDAATITALRAEVAALRAALEPFASPPLYVFDSDRRFVPAPQPDGWIGGGWFSTDDFKRARAALERTNP